MYIPSFFELTDPLAIRSLIEANSFGELITSHSGKLDVNHVPFLYDTENNKLLGHLADQNPQLNILEHADDLQIVFQGPNAYVSPSWYVSPNMVPTWNFECVHVQGKARLLDKPCLIDILTRLSQHHERQFEQPWTMDKLSEKALNAMTRAITGFEIEITGIQAKQKMSQNRSLADRTGVIEGLSHQNDDGSRLVAERMKLIEEQNVTS